MSISKKIRFEVFKRDGFKCVYCGNTPPQIILEIDHIDPSSKGGTDDINNLLTSCFDCNRGKKNISLDKIPNQLSKNLEILKEKETQLRKYRNFLKQIERRESKDIDEINLIYSGHYLKWELSESFKNVTIKKFLRELPKNEIIEAMNIAISRFPNDENKVLSYFCGICWNKIKSKTDLNYSIKKQLEGIWKSRPRGSGYLKKGILDSWLLRYTRDQIAEEMIKANGIWATLHEKLGD